MADGTITVQKQFVVIGVCATLGALAAAAGVLWGPDPDGPRDIDLYSAAANVIWWLGHALWMSMDRRRRGLEPGIWRYLVIFLGPLAIWLYLIVEYRARALYLIPLSLGIYAVLLVVLLGLVVILTGG